ncbi:aquaporin family protein [Flavobacteriaceae bacterium]|nr:aquaporin family protein [Flavobacteriaceae bacterium]MDA8923488.1 aquaporin family protein [Flavobacteriaceae bacterium]MDA9184415.1 aquaporin family protein [Flavobacteriaceae bacterium]MDA9244783.1 aquaporin family protein [Flavobacteriaceae bacterium]MDA9330813.1 aquaporin family protein [Flavobacteriaceae bacterium]
MTPFIAEFIGTSLLLLLGAGVVANVSLKKTYGEDQTPLLLITIAWGFAVFVGAYVTGQFSGAHLNPAVTIGLAIIGKFSWSLVPTYLLAQLLGAMFGSWLCYILYIDHYRETEDEDTIRGTFCTAPAIRNYKNNFFSEALGTFVLVFGIFFIASPNIVIDGTVTQNFGIGSLESLPVAILVWVIGMGLGGTTGYAINPARDFGPRLMYQLLPRKNKRADWAYSWIPVFGPFTGAVVAGLIYNVLMA